MSFFTLISPFKSTINYPQMHILKSPRISAFFSPFHHSSKSLLSFSWINRTGSWLILLAHFFCLFNMAYNFPIQLFNGFSLVFYDIWMLQHDLEIPKRPDPRFLCSSIAHQSYPPPQPSPSSRLPSVIQPVNIYNGLPLPLTLTTDLFFCLDCLSLSRNKSLFCTTY